jgi:hypothetical protein
LILLKDAKRDIGI